MMLAVCRRAVVVAATIASVGFASVVAAAPANADAAACENYLYSKGYIVGPGVIDACEKGENLVGGFDYCKTRLYKIGGIAPADIISACWKAIG